MTTPSDEHPLATMLRAAAAGHFPPPDGRVEILPRPPGRTQGVVAFTAHHVVAADLDAAEVRKRLDASDLGSPVQPPFLAWAAERLGARIGPHDNVLVAPSAPTSDIELVERPDLVDDPRLARSKRVREELRLYSDPERRSLVLICRGLARRWELGLEVDEDHRHRGLGRELIRAAPRLVPDREPLFAQVTPGNARSLRTFLAAGYVPIGGEVLFLPR